MLAAFSFLTATKFYHIVWVYLLFDQIHKFFICSHTHCSSGSLVVFMLRNLPRPLLPLVAITHFMKISQLPWRWCQTSWQNPGKCWGLPEGPESPCLRKQGRYTVPGERHRSPERVMLDIVLALLIVIWLSLGKSFPLHGPLISHLHNGLSKPFPLLDSE